MTSKQSKTYKPDKEFEVESVDDGHKQLFGGKMRTFYHIKWKGYKQKTWEPVVNVVDNKHVVQFQMNEIKRLYCNMELHMDIKYPYRIESDPVCLTPYRKLATEQTVINAEVLVSNEFEWFKLKKKVNKKYNDTTFKI
uniref:Chromo domain-containing protein n=1 Tax=Rhabditophanes sp. KR3021 TaxID=114890 RepID=A0AC35TVY5_9BILA